MIVPWNTDAPIYHPPVATVGLIAVNVLVFAGLLAGGSQTAEHLVLEWGHGLRPWQWLTSTFIHRDVFHLAGNMFFLWGFGLVVEGKLGWWRFLILYLGLGVVASAAEQALMGNAADGGGTWGAAAAIYGLLAIAVLWAPRNELSCLALVSFRPWTFEVSIVGVAFLFLLLQLVLAVFPEPAIDVAALHLLGAVPGSIAGLSMLKLGWVDCEGWDLVSVIAGREGERSADPGPEADEPERPPINAAAELTARREAALAQFRGLLKDGSVSGAYKLHQRLAETIRGWELPADDLLDLVKALHREEAWAESVPLLVEHLRRFPDKSFRVRLRLAQVFARDLDRPAQALQVLSRLPQGPLEGALEKARQDIVRAAAEKRENGVYEIALEDW